ncbi:MAG: ABC transporter substrate-binding protein, partial [Planctomycetia bacterium]|nr:ABC transporter substrate-binding protein [Planctomycetia bacterium]
MRITTRLAGLATVLSCLSLALAVAPTSAAPAAPRGALRFAVAARAGAHSNFTPLVYWGGFQSKTALYEPLVRFDDAGTLVGVLLERWDVSGDGLTYRLTLRPGVTGHDGAVLDAEAVRDHLVRWRGNPGNRWLGSTDRFERIDVASPLEVVVKLASPWCFLEEAAIVNPGHVVAAGAYDHEGTFRRTLGTGPYRLDGDLVTGDAFTLLPHDGWWQGAPGLARVDCVRLPATLREHPDLVAWVRDGGVDLVADGEGPVVPREALAAAAKDPRVRVLEGPGSGTTFLLFNTARGPFADRALRHRAAGAVERARLVAEGELGFADPATTLFRAGVAGWPAARAAAPAPSAPAPAARVAATRLLGVEPRARLVRHGRLLAEMLGRAGVDLRVESLPTRDALTARLKAGDWDAVLRSTHGTPYDPFVALQTLFAPNTGRTASSS